MSLEAIEQVIDNSQILLHSLPNLSFDPLSREMLMTEAFQYFLCQNNLQIFQIRSQLMVFILDFISFGALNWENLMNNMIFNFTYGDKGQQMFQSRIIYVSTSYF